MPALDFPANPTNGQVYGNWIWSSSKGAWQAKPMESAKTVTSDVPPANPADGDQWFSTVDGVLYVYVVDIDGGQWVESRSAIISDGYYSPNYIINGGFDIWQRGTSFAGGTTQYLADRWKSEATDSVNCTFTQSTVVPDGATYSIAVTKATADSVSQIRQNIETIEVAKFAGKTVTFSGYVSATSTTQVAVYIDYSTTTDASPGSTMTQIASSFISATSTFQRVAVTADIPSTAKTVRVRFRVPTHSVGVTWYVSKAQLEEGSVATPFRRNANSIQGELAACQRYYYRLQPGQPSRMLMAGQATTATQATVFTNHPVTMRANPSFGFNGSFQQHTGGVAISSVSALTLTNSTTTMAEVASTAGSGFRAGDYCRIQTADGSSFIEFIAEL